MTDYNDGNWHGWNGGECPVHPESIVEGVYINSHAFPEPKQDPAKNFAWHKNNPLELVAFRVVKPYREPRTFWINEYKNWLGFPNKSKEEADEKDAGRTRVIKVVEVEQFDPEIKTASLAEIRRMKDRGELLTKPDAPEKDDVDE